MLAKAMPAFRAKLSRIDNLSVAGRKGQFSNDKFFRSLAHAAFSVCVVHGSSIHLFALVCKYSMQPLDTVGNKDLTAMRRDGVGP